MSPEELISHYAGVRKRLYGGGIVQFAARPRHQEPALESAPAPASAPDPDIEPNIEPELQAADERVFYLRGILNHPLPRKVMIDDIQRAVAIRYNVSQHDILSARRTANVVLPRQIAMYLAKTLTLFSLTAIARRFGGRDHTTVLLAVRKIERLMDADQKLSGEIEMLKKIISGARP